MLVEMLSMLRKRCLPMYLHMVAKPRRFLTIQRVGQRRSGRFGQRRFGSPIGIQVSVSESFYRL